MFNGLPLQLSALLVASVATASVTTLCGFVVVGDGRVGCHHLNLLSLLAQSKLLAELHADRGTKHPVKAVSGQVAFIGTGADGNAWVCRVGSCGLALDVGITHAAVHLRVDADHLCARVVRQADAVALQHFLADV